MAPITPYDVKRVWWSKGSRASTDVSIYTSDEHHYDAYTLGMTAVAGLQANATLNSGLLYQSLFNDPKHLAFSAPTGWTLIWSNNGFAGEEPGSVFKAICPENYVAMGDVWVKGYGPPNFRNFRCVRKDFLVNCSLKKIWTNVGSGEPRSCTVYTVYSPIIPGSNGFLKAHNHVTSHPYLEAYCIPLLDIKELLEKFFGKIPHSIFPG